MILRLIVLMGSGGFAYLLLRGWPAEVPGLLRGCLALLILLGGLVLWTGRVKKEEGEVLAKGGRKPGWMDYGWMGMGLLALECVFLWVLSATPEPLERVAGMMEEKFWPEWGEEVETDEVVEGEGEDEVSGNWLWDGEDERTLPRRANLKLGARPEVFVRFLREEDGKRLEKEQLYVRAFALDRYEDGVWRSMAEDERVLEADEEGWIRYGSAQEGEVAHEVFHGKDAGGRNFLTALQGVRAVRLPVLRRVGDGREVLPELGSERGYRYYASSLPIRLKDVEGVDWAVEVVAGDDERMRELALKVAGEGGVVERLQRIEKHLKEGYEYSLVVENPKDMEPLDNFLYGEKKGHCEFFATAGALMARELGVESRVAYGWTSGQYLVSTKMYVFRARDAHAWVEVMVPGRGWVMMEPTPSSAFGTVRQEQEVKGMEQEPEIADVYAEEEVVVMAEEWRGGYVVLVVAGACAFVAAVLVLMRKRRMSVGIGSGIGYEEKESGGYFGAWKGALRRRGRGVVGRTMREDLRKMGEVPEFAEELVKYHYGVRYEGETRDGGVERGLEKRIREW